MKISLELLKNGLGTLSGLSWRPLGTLWGGVLGPLERFGAALGRPGGAQELSFGVSARRPRGPQEGPKEGEKEFTVILNVPRRSKTPQMAPKIPQNGPQEAPKRLPRGCQDVLACLFRGHEKAFRICFKILLGGMSRSSKCVFLSLHIVLRRVPQSRSTKTFFAPAAFIDVHLMRGRSGETCKMIPGLS